MRKSWSKKSVDKSSEELVLAVINLQDEIDDLSAESDTQTTHAMGKTKRPSISASFSCLPTKSDYQKKLEEFHKLSSNIPAEVQDKISQIRSAFQRDGLIDWLQNNNDFLSNHPEIIEKLNEYKIKIITYILQHDKSPKKYGEFLTAKEKFLDDWIDGLPANESFNKLKKELLKQDKKCFEDMSQVASLEGLINNNSLSLSFLKDGISYPNNISLESFHEMKKIFKIVEQHPELVVTHNDLLININFVRKYKDSLSMSAIRKLQDVQEALEDFKSDYESAIEHVNDANINMFKIAVDKIDDMESNKEDRRNSLRLQSHLNTYAKKYDDNFAKMTELWGKCYQGLEDIVSLNFLPEELHELQANLSSMIEMLNKYRKNFAEIPDKYKSKQNFLQVDNSLKVVVEYLQDEHDAVKEKFEQNYGSERQRHGSGHAL